MPRSAEAFDQVREQSREKILHAALELFARRGFANTSVRMLAEHAGVSQGLLYNYFDGKRGLLRTIVERSMSEVRQTFEAAEAATPEESLAVLIRAAVEAVRGNREFWALNYQIRLQPDVLVDVGVDLGGAAEQIRMWMQQLLTRAGLEDAAVRSRVVFAAIDGIAQHYVLDPERYPLEAVAEEAIRLLVPRHGRSKANA